SRQPATTRATCPRSHSLRRWDTGSASACWRVDPPATASGCGPMIRCAAATCRWRCAIPCSTTLPGSACVADRPHLIVSALHGAVKPGRYGRVTASPGVTVTEVQGAALATVAARKGRRGALLDAARSAFGAELPTTPRRAEGRDIAFIWSGPDQ